MAADSHSFTKTHFQDPNPTSSLPTQPPKSKLYFIHYFISKSLIIVLVILVFLYFPSQVPDYFKKTTIVTKLWDLIYLLVIGIAVCYGLFSRKIDTSVHSCDDDNIKETYLSEISHISSIFENGVQGFNGFDEKDLFEEFKGSGSRFHGFGIGKPKLVRENKGLCLPVQNIGSKSAGKSLGKDSSNDEKYVVEKLGKPDTIRDNKPLCLPVRNLGSKSLDSATGKSGVRDWLSDWDETKNGKFRGLVPIKLEEKFKENDSDSDSNSNSNSDSASRSPLNWRSKSTRLEKREDVSTIKANETSNIRPFSVDVVDFEGLKSQSMRYSMPSQMKKVSNKEESKGMEPNLNVETSFMETKPRVLSLGSSFEMNNRFSSKEILKDFEKIEVDDGSMDLHNNEPFIKSESQRSSVGASSEMNLQSSEYVLAKEEKSDSTNLIKKPAPVANSYKRGKSVRTNRPKEQVLDANVKAFPVQTIEEVEIRSKRKNNATNVITDDLSDTEPHSGEVDRKAEEFIAKFREQIRLQKVASARKLSI